MIDESSTRTIIRHAILASVAALASAGLLALAQPPFGLAPLALVALVPWLCAVVRVKALAAAALGFGTGVAYAAAAMPWGVAALRSLGASPLEALVGFLIGAAWGKGIPFSVVGVLVYAVRAAPPSVRILGASAGFALLDALHSSGSAGIPFALLGHTQGSALGVAQLAVVGGVPLISGLVAAINQAAAIAWEARGTAASLRTLAALAAAWGGLALLGVPIAHWARGETPAAMRSTASMLLVQPNLPRGERWAENLQESHLERVVELSVQGLSKSASRPSVVVWPENLLTAPLDATPERARALENAVDRIGVAVLLGAVRSAHGSEPGLYRSSVLWVEPGRGVVAAQDKQRAVPLLEAQSRSALAVLVGRAFGAAAGGRKVEEASAAGPLRAPIPVVVVLCYEALFPALVAERRTDATLAIVNLADDSWVADRAASAQLAAFARFRAIEARLPLVRVAHGGLSVVVDAYGETQMELPQHTWAQGRVEVAAGPPPTRTEKTALPALPLASGAGVWWALGPWSRRRFRARGSREAAPPGGALDA